MEPHAASLPSDAIAARPYKPILILGQIVVMIVIILGEFYAGHLESNDQDVLPFSRHFMDHDWVPGDWYLNLDIPYRYVADLMVGPLVVAFGFDDAAIISRLVVYALLASATYILFRSLGLRFTLMLIILYAFLPHQSWVTREWIYGGAEAKSFAYAFVLLSTAGFLTQRYVLAFAFAGAAISFHVLVGVYALFSAVGAMLLNYESYWPQRRTIFHRSWILLVTGAFGIYAVSTQLRVKASGVAAKAAEIYVRFRVPHHVFPGVWWGGRRLIVEMIAAIALFVLTYLYGRSRASRYIAAYALCSTVLFMIGLGIYFAGDIPLLKYYWFRFPDVMVPLMSWVLLGMIINDLADGQAPFRRLPRWNSLLATAASPLQRAWRMMLPAGAVVIVAVSTVHLLQSESNRQEEEQVSVSKDAPADGDEFANDGKAIQPMYGWIAQHTPRDSVFLVDPMRSDFYMRAERARLVSFRHSPQTEADIAQWYERLTLCNGGQPPRNFMEITPHFYSLDRAAIQHIAALYGLDYYLGRTRQPLSFDRVHSVNGFTLYRLDRNPKAQATLDSSHPQ